MAKYTVFGDDPLPYSSLAYADGGPSIEAGNIFYTTSANGPVDNWQCTGARVWVPNDPTVTNRSITIRVYVGTLVTGTSAAFGAIPLREKMTTTPSAGGWCEVMWDTPFITDNGPDACFMAVKYIFNDPADAGKYFAAISGVSANAIPSVSAGESLVLAEAVAVDTYQWSRRGEYIIDTSPSDSTTYYSTDIIMDSATAPGSIAPVAAYGFNESTGTTINDSTGNGWNLTTLSENFVQDGHYSTAITSPGDNLTAFPDFGAQNTYTALDLTTNRAYTFMFWARRDTIDGTGWTIEQTTFNGIATSVGIRISDGTNTVFHIRPGGYDIEYTTPHQPLGEWHHYALTSTSYRIRCYVDGNLVQESAQSGTYTTDNDLVSFSYGTSMDDLYIFNAALTASAIQYYMARTINDNTRSGKIKIWNGTTWQAHPIKSWDGSSWATHPAKGTEDGSNFILGKD